MSLERHVASRFRAIAVASTLFLVVGCSIGSGTLGGRVKCWTESDRRMASVWRGILRIDARGGRLDTPEGESIPLRAGALWTRMGTSGGELVQDTGVVAKAGDDVTLFGGAGPDGTLVVCAVEEIHARS